MAGKHNEVPVEREPSIQNALKLDILEPVTVDIDHLESAHNQMNFIILTAGSRAAF